MGKVRKGQKVTDIDGRLGTTTGGKRRCPVDKCPGQQIAIRWENGQLSYCCTEEMSFKNDVWRIKQSR